MKKHLLFTFFFTCATLCAAAPLSELEKRAFVDEFRRRHTFMYMGNENAGKTWVTAFFFDLDGDGLEDVLVAIKPQTILWLRRLDTTGRNWEQYPINMVANTGMMQGVAVGDINGDGKQEIVVSCAIAKDEQHGIFWLSYDKSPQEPIWKAHVLSGTEGKKFDQVFLCDFNGDGKLDVITTEEMDGPKKEGLGVIWYENPL